MAITNMKLMDVLEAQIEEIQSLSQYPIDHRDFIMRKADVTAKLAEQVIANSKVILEAELLATSTSPIVDKEVHEDVREEETL